MLPTLIVADVGDKVGDSDEPPPPPELPPLEPPEPLPPPDVPLNILSTK